MKKQASTVGLVLLAVAMTVGMTSTATAAESNNSETTTVSVNVSTTTALDVKPDQLTYDSVTVGDRVNETDNGHGFETLFVENTGSQEIEKIWMSSELPQNDPFGSANGASSSDHNSTNFLQIKPNGDETAIRGDSSTYHYVERVEFLQDDNPLVEVGDFNDSTSGGYDDVDVGRARFGNNEFYFALGYDGGTCDTGEIRVASDSTTPTSLGTTDFTVSNDANWNNASISGTGGDGYGIAGSSFSFSLDSGVANLDSSETQTYDIMTKCDSFPTNEGINEPHVTLAKYDVEAGGTTDLNTGDGNTATQLYRTGGSDYLEPGNSISADVAVQVARGVPAGDISPGTLTVYSRAAPVS